MKSSIHYLILPKKGCKACEDTDVFPFKGPVFSEEVSAEWIENLWLCYVDKRHQGIFLDASLDLLVQG